MSLLVVTTYPQARGRVFEGAARREADGSVTVAGERVFAPQRASALLGAACEATGHLGAEPPYALVAGDIGQGGGTRTVFARLSEVCAQMSPTVVVFHHVQPIAALMRHAVAELTGRAPDIMLVADAGGMYAAKAAGLAPRFELMTPSAGEVGFLADPDATHPAYASHHRSGATGCDPAELARTAAQSGGASRVLLIKGQRDLVVEDGMLVAVVDEPCVPELEAIGGTGDAITGLAAAFLAAGFPTVDAAVCASRAVRAAGAAMGARPDHRAHDLVSRLPRALDENLCAWAGVCTSSR